MNRSCIVNQCIRVNTAGGIGGLLSRYDMRTSKAIQAGYHGRRRLQQDLIEKEIASKPLQATPSQGGSLALLHLLGVSHAPRRVAQQDGIDQDTPKILGLFWESLGISGLMGGLMRLFWLGRSEGFKSLVSDRAEMGS